MAAILNFFPGAIVLAWGHRLRLVGGWRKGGESPSCGGSRSRGRASVVGWRGTCRGVGGTFPAPAFPLGETGKGDQIPCCRRQFDVAPTVCTPLLSYVLFCPSSLPMTVTNIFVLSILSPSRSAFQIFQKSRRRTHCLPCFYPHSEWGRDGPGASWGPI